MFRFILKIFIATIGFIGLNANAHANLLKWVLKNVK